MRSFRKESRTKASGALELRWEIGAGYVRSCVASLRDISASGMGLSAAIPFSVGSTVQIKANGITRYATIRRCTREGTHYFLGVQLEPTVDRQGSKIGHAESQFYPKSV